MVKKNTKRKVVKKPRKAAKKSPKRAKTSAKPKVKSSSTYEITIQRQRWGHAPEKYHFVLKSGQRIKSIQDLASSLEHMADDTFHHHVSEFKNDFSTWVEDVFNEKDLATEMQKVSNKIDTEIKLLRRIVKKARSI